MDALPIKVSDNSWTKCMLLESFLRGSSVRKGVEIKNELCMLAKADEPHPDLVGRNVVVLV